MAEGWRTPNNKNIETGIEIGILKDASTLMFNLIIVSKSQLQTIKL